MPKDGWNRKWCVEQIVCHNRCQTKATWFELINISIFIYERVVLRGTRRWHSIIFWGRGSVAHKTLHILKVMKLIIWNNELKEAAFVWLSLDKWYGIELEMVQNGMKLPFHYLYIFEQKKLLLWFHFSKIGGEETKGLSLNGMDCTSFGSLQF